MHSRFRIVNIFACVFSWFMCDFLCFHVSSWVVVRLFACLARVLLRLRIRFGIEVAMRICETSPLSSCDFHRSHMRLCVTSRFCLWLQISMWHHVTSCVYQCDLCSIRVKTKRYEFMDYEKFLKSHMCNVGCLTATSCVLMWLLHKFH